MKYIAPLVCLIFIIVSCDKEESRAINFVPLEKFDAEIHHAILSGEYSSTENCCLQNVTLNFQKSFDGTDYMKTVYGGNGLGDIQSVRIDNTDIPLTSDGSSEGFSYSFSNESTTIIDNGTPTETLPIEEYKDVPFDLEINNVHHVASFPNLDHLTDIKLVGIIGDKLSKSTGVTVEWKSWESTLTLDVKIQISDLKGTDIEIFTENDGEHYISSELLNTLDSGERLIVSLYSANYMLNNEGILVSSLDIQHFGSDLFLSD